MYRFTKTFVLLSVLSITLLTNTANAQWTGDEGDWFGTDETAMSLGYDEYDNPYSVEDMAVADYAYDIGWYNEDAAGSAAGGTFDYEPAYIDYGQSLEDYAYNGDLYPEPEYITDFDYGDSPYYDDTYVYEDDYMYYDEAYYTDTASAYISLDLGINDRSSYYDVAPRHTNTYSHPSYSYSTPYYYESAPSRYDDSDTTITTSETITTDNSITDSFNNYNYGNQNIAGDNSNTPIVLYAQPTPTPVARVRQPINIVNNNYNNNINSTAPAYTPANPIIYNPPVMPVAGAPITVSGGGDSSVTVINNNYNNNVNKYTVSTQVYYPPTHLGCDCVVLSHLPYTGASDYMYLGFLLTMILTVGYALYRYGIMWHNARLS